MEDMKKLEEKLVSFGFECFLPRFSLGDFSAKKIGEIKNKRKEKGLQKGELEKITNVTKWFYKKIKECDAMVVFDKQGYVGLAAASEIGAAYILKKPVFFLEEPEDVSIKAMIRFVPNFKVAGLEKLIRELRLKK